MFCPVFPRAKFLVVGEGSKLLLLRKLLQVEATDIRNCRVFDTQNSYISRC